MKRLWSLGLALLAAVAVLGACVTPKSPPPAVAPAGPVSHTTGFGPPKGFSITQELTSRADVTWNGDLPGRGQVRERRESGLRMLATFEVLERGENTAVIRADMQQIEVLQGGEFVPAPILLLEPPTQITFKVNYKFRSVDFTAAERAYDAWMKRLHSGSTGAVALAGSFNVRSYITQLRDLFGHTALDFAGNTYAFRKTVSEKKEFFVPLPGPGLAVGPIDVDLSSTLRYVEVSEGRRTFRITGELGSRYLRLDAPALGARMSALQVTAPPAFESEGTLMGTVEAQVDAATGWTTEMKSLFVTATTAGFAGGAFTETVRGTRQAVTR